MTMQEKAVDEKTPIRGECSEQYDVFDITKLLLSIAIVAIHTRLGGTWETSPLYPWLRVAVPLFFMISSFLFFRKYDALDELGKKNRLKKFIVRNGQLYLFWFLLLFIPTIFAHRSWFESGILEGIWHFILSFLFGSTFYASWYITANVIAVTIIALASKWLPNTLIALVSVLGYVVACLASNYGNLDLFNGRPIAEMLVPLQPFLGNPCNNFAVALLWVLLGRYAAQGKFQLKIHTGRKIAIIVMLTCGLTLLFVEQMIIRVFETAYSNDCYLTLPISVFLLFLLILNSKIDCKNSFYMRNVSTITYCFHGTLTAFVIKVFEYFGIYDYGAGEFAIVLCVSWIVAWLIIRLEKKPLLAFLRYAH